MRFRSPIFILQIYKNIKSCKKTVLSARKTCSSCLLLSVPLRLSCDTTSKIQEPDASKLSREYLIKSSSVTSSDYALILHTQVALALQQAEVEYKEALHALAFLLEFKLNVLGNQSEEARIWNLILEARSLVNNSKRKKDDLDLLYSRTHALVSTAAEVTYMTGCDAVGSSAGDRLMKLEHVVREERTKSENAEQKLQDTEVKVINVEGKYAEEHAEQLEEEHKQVLQELDAIEAQANNEQQDKQTGKTNEDSDEFDIILTSGETLTDDTAKQI